MKTRRQHSSPSLTLAINSGSSSIKFALYHESQFPERLCSGEIERIGLPKAVFAFREAKSEPKHVLKLTARNHRDAAKFLIRWLELRVGHAAIAVIGHRIVHGGGKFSEPALVTPKLLNELRRLSPFDEEHVPAELALLETFARAWPSLPQVACFDTAFHHQMPRVAQMLALPRKLEKHGVRRYGFHGLSYEFLLGELARVAGQHAAHGRLVLAHLGNGASMAAVHQGKCVDTSMGFTPAAGLPMSTRAGDLDPGLVLYLAKKEKISPEQFNTMINKKSGLLGVSETSSDMRDLLAREKKDRRAAEAVALFCYQAKKWIGAYAAALGGLNTLVFAGGIGENSPTIRQRICAQLDFLGLVLEPAKNAGNAAVISTRGSRVTVRVIPTDEALVIARSANRILAKISRQAKSRK